MIATGSNLAFVGHHVTPPEESANVRLRLDIAYDGTDFHGWAVQPGLRTVQGEIESALRVMVREPENAPVLTVGGRTDAGVHSRGQVAHFDLNAQTAARVSARRINSLLARKSPDVVIHSVTQVTEDFDARFSALRRRYEYRLADRSVKHDPLTRRFTAVTDRDIDVELMQRAADELLGLNDFTSFCKAREGATAVRDLLLFEWSQEQSGVFVARIEADAFCHSMVRSLIGAVSAVGQGRISLAELRDLRDARVRTNKFPVMPANGLSLEEIVYPDDHELAERASATRARRDAVPSVYNTLESADDSSSHS